MTDNELKKIPKTGTCTLGIVCKDGIVIGADRRTSLGDTGIISPSRATKVIKLLDNIVVTTAGNVSDIQFVIKLARAELKLKTMKTKQVVTVKEAANLFASILYQQIRQFSSILAISHFLIAGKDSSGIRLFEATPDGSVNEYKNFVTSGAFGSMFIWTLLKQEWNENLTLQEGKDLAIKVLKSAVEFDATVGEPINLVVINKDGVGALEEYTLTREELKQKK